VARGRLLPPPGSPIPDPDDIGSFRNGRTGPAGQTGDTDWHWGRGRKNGPGSEEDGR
jgi:hypothetical protein